MKPLSAFYDYLLPQLPGITTPMVDIELRLVARELCDRTGVWAAPFPVLQADAGESTYPLFGSEAKTEVVRLHRLTVATVLEWSRSEDDKARYPVHLPPFVVSNDGTSITFKDQPAGDIEMVGAMRPSLTATQLPDFMLSHQVETLRKGVLSRLMRMPGKPWTNLDLSRVYGVDYATALNREATDAARGHTRARLRTTNSPI